MTIDIVNILKGSDIVAKIEKNLMINSFFSPIYFYFNLVCDSNYAKRNNICNYICNYIHFRYLKICYTYLDTPIS